MILYYILVNSQFYVIIQNRLCTCHVTFLLQNEDHTLRLRALGLERRPLTFAQPARKRRALLKVTVNAKKSKLLSNARNFGQKGEKGLSLPLMSKFKVGSSKVTISPTSKLSESTKRAQKLLNRAKLHVLKHESKTITATATNSLRRKRQSKKSLKASLSQQQNNEDILMDNSPKGEPQDERPRKSKIKLPNGTEHVQ